MATFSERLCEALQMRNMKPSQLAKLLDVDQATIHNYQIGKYAPKQTRTEQIANILNVSIPWLMGADISPEIVNPFDKINDSINKSILKHKELYFFNLSKLGKPLCTCYLTEKQKDIILSMISSWEVKELELNVGE